MIEPGSYFIAQKCSFPMCRRLRTRILQIALWVTMATAPASPASRVKPLDMRSLTSARVSPSAIRSFSGDIRYRANASG